MEECLAEGHEQTKGPARCPRKTERGTKVYTTSCVRDVKCVLSGIELSVIWITNTLQSITGCVVSLIDCTMV